VQNILLAQTWYTAQIFPITGDSIRQINIAIAWFLWQGSIFRVPLSTLQQKQQGGWGLTNIAAKSRTLFFYRLQVQVQEPGTLTAAWLRRWNLLTRSANPPNINTMPATLEYLRHYATDTAYITPQNQKGIKCSVQAPNIQHYGQYALNNNSPADDVCHATMGKY
jgi:hypothetical protein